VARGPPRIFESGGGSETGSGAMPPAAVDRGSTRSDSVAAAAQRVTGSAISKGAKGGVVVVATPAAMTDGAILSARERLRLHVQRNLALQESAARTAQVSPHTQGSATAAGSPATQKAPPKSAKKTSSSSSTPPPILQAGSISKASASGLEDLYAPHEDTRLGAADLRSGNSDGYLVRPPTPLSHTSTR